MHPTPQNAAQRLVKVASHWLQWLGAILILAGCATKPPPADRSIDARLAGFQIAPGPILILSPPQTATIHVDAGEARLEFAGEGAASAARAVLNTPDLHHAQLEAVVSVLGFAAAPFAAAYGAVRSSQQKLSPSEVREVQERMVTNMRANAGSEPLRDKVAEAARQRTRRTILCEGGDSDKSARSAEPSARLEVLVEQLALRRSPAEKREHTLEVRARARLIRCSDGAVLVDRPYRFQSGPALFIDWAEYGGLESVAQTAYQSIADQIADQIFQPVSEPPLLIGPGQAHTRTLRLPVHEQAAKGATAGWAVSSSHTARGSFHPIAAAKSEQQTSGHVQSGGGAQRTAHPTAVAGSPHRPLRAYPHRLVSQSRMVRFSLGRVCPKRTRSERHIRVLCQAAVPGAREGTDGATVTNFPPAASGVTNVVVNEPAFIEVYAGKPGEHLRLRSPPGSENSAGPGAAQTDTEWKMDGLENDRNAVVQAVSCVAAVPMGLWEQTFGAFHRGLRERNEALTRTLEEIPRRQHLEIGMADTVARQLRLVIINPVLRTEAPAPLALSGPAAPGQSARARDASAGAGGLALDLQVVDVRLAGRHKHSQSCSLCVEVQATVVRTADGQELYSRPIRYQSSSRRLEDWAASDAALFRHELEACSTETAQAVTRELVGRGFVTRSADRRDDSREAATPRESQGNRQPPQAR